MENNNKYFPIFIFIRENIDLIDELGTLIGGMGAIVNVFVGEIKLMDIKKYNIDHTEVKKYLPFRFPIFKPVLLKYII